MNWVGFMCYTKKTSLDTAMSDVVYDFGTMRVAEEPGILSDGIYQWLGKMYLGEGHETRQKSICERTIIPSSRKAGLSQGGPARSFWLDLGVGGNVHTIGKTDQVGSGG